LPLLEAAYFNCPIIASDIEVFKEILGREYLSFNPYCSEDIAEKINFFLQKKPKFNYQKIIQKYSFKKMTDEILKIYQQVI
jgi:glycosyltransferase involved in cell wall biosynthesis